jgi:hypothetical protein
VVDHFSQIGVWNSAFNLNGIPVFLVHVIAGPDLVVSVAEVER